MDASRRRISIGTFRILMVLMSVITVMMLKEYLIAMIMGIILTLMVAPVHRFFLARKFKPTAAAATVTLLVTLVLIGPGLTFAGIAARQGVSFVEWMAKQEEFNLEGVTSWLNQRLPASFQIELDEELRQQVKTSATAVGKSATNFVLGLARQIPEAVMQIFIILLTCFFVLADGNALIRWISDKIPIASELRQTLAGAFQNTAISVVWASMVAAATQAVLMFAGFMILGIPAAFLAGGSTFIFAFIPVLGSGPVVIAGCIYLYLQGSVMKMFVLIGIGVLTGLADNIVRPVVLKGRGEMHPFISFIAIFGGLEMFGFFGVFLGPIIAAVLISMIQVWPRIVYPETNGNLSTEAAPDSP
jgi:predicted PurR-regulated permease PerM